MSNTALIVVDVQNDFMPGGALAVPEGDEVIPVINKLMGARRGDPDKGFDYVIATQDWHPADHGSFASNHGGAEVGEVRKLDGLDQIMWPDHCVQGSQGALFVDGLNTEYFLEIFTKGEDPLVDSYSGFYDNARRNSTGLTSYLRQRDVEKVYVVGVATDYCVKFTVLDAIEDGFDTYLIEDACRGVDLNEGDVESAVEGMRNAGAEVVNSEEVL